MIRVVASVLSASLLFALAGHAALAGQGDPALGPAQIDKVLASARQAAGGAELDRYAVVAESGTISQNGGAPSAFDTVVDLRNGNSRARLIVGPATFLQGYDGAEWSSMNGALTIVSLPSLKADAVTQAYLSSNAFLRASERSTVVSGRVGTVDGQKADVLRVEPRGGSPADLYFDAATSHLVRVVAATAHGIDTSTFSDFQTVQGMAVPMSQTDVDPSGTKTVTTVSTVRFAQTPQPDAFARPAYTSRGTLAAPVSIPFVSDVAGAIGHLVVPVTLDGKTASLIFDSGGGNFLVPQAATALGLHASGSIATGGAGTKDQATAIAAVSKVDFGGAILSHQNFVVTPLSYIFLHPRKGVVGQGLIGFEYLSNFRVSVRYADRRIDVAPFGAPSPAGGVTLPFKSDGVHAYVLGSVDGVSGYYLLDTGNGGGILLNAPFVRAHHLFAKGGPTYQSPGGVGGGFAITAAAAKSFAFAGRTFHDVPVDIPQVTSGFFATRGVAGNLGGAFLSRFTVVFDYKAQTVTFIPNRNVGEAFRSDRTGLSLDQADASAFEVTRVVPGSPAAVAGIAAGDRIVAVAGTTVASGLGLGDLHPYAAGTAPVALSVTRAGTTRTVTIVPRTLLPPAQ